MFGSAAPPANLPHPNADLVISGPRHWSMNLPTWADNPANLVIIHDEQPHDSSAYIIRTVKDQKALSAPPEPPSGFTSAFASVDDDMISSRCPLNSVRDDCTEHDGLSPFTQASLPNTDITSQHRPFNTSNGLVATAQLLVTARAKLGATKPTELVRSDGEPPPRPTTRPPARPGAPLAEIDPEIDPVTAAVASLPANHGSGVDPELTPELLVDRPPPRPSLPVLSPEPAAQLAGSTLPQEDSTVFSTVQTTESAPGPFSPPLHILSAANSTQVSSLEASCVAHSESPPGGGTSPADSFVFVGSSTSFAPLPYAAEEVYVRPFVALTPGWCDPTFDYTPCHITDTRAAARGEL